MSPYKNIHVMSYLEGLRKLKDGSLLAKIFSILWSMRYSINSNLGYIIYPNLLVLREESSWEILIRLSP